MYELISQQLLYTFIGNNPLAWYDFLGLKVELLIGGPYKDITYGHAAIRVFGNGYDMVYDFGRYGKTWGTGGSQGEGMLRVWTNFCCYINGENATGRTTYGYEYDTTPEQDILIIEYYKNIVSGINPNLSRKNKKSDKEYMNQYKLDKNYHAANYNCVILVLDGFAKGMPDIFKKINDEQFDQGEGLSFINKTAYKLSKEGEGVRMPFDLKKAIETIKGFSGQHTYSSKTKCERN